MVFFRERRVLEQSMVERILLAVSGSLSEMETRSGSRKKRHHTGGARQFSRFSSAGGLGAGTMPGGRPNGVMYTPGATIVDNGGPGSAADEAAGLGAADSGDTTGGAGAVGAAGAGTECASTVGATGARTTIGP
jgi:hypothetical protein